MRRPARIRATAKRWPADALDRGARRRSCAEGLNGLKTRRHTRPGGPRAAEALCLLLAAAGCGHVSPPAPTSLTASLGRFGRNPGQFSWPRAAACGPRGVVAAADKTGRIQVFDAQGRLLAHWRMPQIAKGTPTGVCFDSAGRLFVADTHYSRIIVFSLRGEQLAAFGSYGQGPGQFIYPTDAAVAPDGRIYVAEYGEHDRISVFDSSFRFLFSWGDHGAEPGRFRRPMGLALDAKGCVYVADAVNHRIQKFSPEGRLLAAWGKPGRRLGEMTYPYDVAVAGDALFVCEYGGCRVQKFTLDGRPLGVFGRPGRGPNEFNSPWSLDVAADGRLYVADCLNHRLLILGAACPFASPSP